MRYSHNTVAAKVRKEKEEHPERFCGRGTCLYRTLHPVSRLQTPCPKHGPRVPAKETPEQAAAEARARADREARAVWFATHTTADIPTTSNRGSAFGPERAS